MTVAAVEGVRAPASVRRVAFAGNPNTGKSSLFNRVTGGVARVGNYAGVTVEREIGRWRLPGGDVEVVDVPGAYSLASRSAEEQVAMRALFGLDGDERPAAVVLVVDSTQVVRNLYLATWIIEAGIPAVVALNLIDAARAAGVAPDAARVSEALGVPVVATSATTGEGVGVLADALERVLRDPDLGRAAPRWRYPAPLAADLDRIAALVSTSSPSEARALAAWALLSVADDDELDVPPSVRAAVGRVRAEAERAGRDVDAELIGARYAWLDGLELAQGASTARNLTDRIDAWLLHPLYGTPVFIAVMATLFQALFAWSDPAIGAIEQLFGLLADGTRAALPPGLVADFVADALIGGVGGVVVFLPQILLLFFLLGVLEDSGYMARVAYLVDRGMRAIGLHGRAFVPMLSGYACAVPAVMATRTLERQRDRLLTMLVVPLMSCSARLPVYTLVIATIFPVGTVWFGFLPAPVTLMVGMYVFSTATALLAAAVIGRTLVRGRHVPLLLELPPYRMPRARSLLRQVWLRGRTFLTEAGTVILACTVVLWFLLTFPRAAPVGSEAARAAATSDIEIAAIDAAEEGARLRASYGGQLGRAVEPLIAPLGFDWKIGIGLVGAFAAREVFVSTMGVVYGIGAEADEASVPLRERMRLERTRDGRPLWTPLVGVSLMVFFALSAQCMSTLAAVRRESGSWRWAAFTFVYMTALAWVASFVVFQGGRLLGLE